MFKEDVIEALHRMLEDYADVRPCTPLSFYVKKIWIGYTSGYGSLDNDGLISVFDCTSHEPQLLLRLDLNDPSAVDKIIDQVKASERR